jgi:hypothetical protein
VLAENVRLSSSISLADNDKINSASSLIERLSIKFNIGASFTESIIIVTTPITDVHPSSSDTVKVKLSSPL